MFFCSCDTVKMTRVKKWFLESVESEGGVELRNSNGAIKKPNATGTLGMIVEVSVPDPEKYDEESVMV